MAFKSKAEAREAARKGGLARAAKFRAKDAPSAPFAGTILDAMDAAQLTGPSWEAWRAFWRVVTGLPLSDADRATYARHTGRARTPAGPLRSLWTIAGRRSGKSRAGAALFAIWTAVRRDYAGLLAPGEKATLPIVAADRRQARQTLSYLKGMARLPAFAPYVASVLKDSVAFTTGCTVEVHSASWRTTRGFSAPAVVLDELAFFANESDSANPDSEILAALLPTMVTIPGALLFACSTPYAARGELFKAHERAYGVELDDVLVWRAASLDMNPSLDAATIATAYEDDPVAAASEWGGEFRRDVQGFLDVAAIRAVTVPGRRELPPTPSLRYAAFVDPSGGSQDAMTLAIAHAETHGDADPFTPEYRARAARSGLVPAAPPPQTGVAVLDVVREMRPPFSPDAVVGEFADLLRSYNLSTVTGDRYGGEWPRERFAKAGIRYVPADKTKSELYLELLPLVNAGRCELLDVPRLAAQLAGLARYVGRGGKGKDAVDHAPGGHDDVSNAAAGALALALAVRGHYATLFSFSI